MTDPTQVYTADQVDQMFTSYYTKDEVDAMLELLQPAKPVNPPATHARVVGSGDMSGFKGLPLTAHRTYNGYGATRQQNATLALANVTADAAAGRRPYFSIGAGNNKAHPGGPKDWYTDLKQTDPAIFLPAVKVTMNAYGVVIIHHEPEDDPGTAMNFKTWFSLMSDWYKTQVPGVRIGLCLMEYTGRKGGPGFQTWTPDPSKWDVFCLDGYVHKTGQTAADLFGPGIQYARTLKKPIAITETGQEMWNDQVKYIQSLADLFNDPKNSDIEALMYWNGGNAKAAGPNQHNYHLQPAAVEAFGALVKQYATPSTQPA